jgi:plastocyanin domain-containing protein
MKTALWIALLALGCTAKEHAHDKAQGNTAPAVAPLAVTGRRIDIKVSKMGYEPGSVPVKANEQVTLVFTRVEPTECGSVIAIPSLHLRKSLPLNQPVAIDVKPDKAGDVEFTCGMSMMRGTLVVSL